MGTIAYTATARLGKGATMIPLPDTSRVDPLFFTALRCPECGKNCPSWQAAPREGTDKPLLCRECRGKESSGNAVDRSESPEL